MIRLPKLLARALPGADEDAPINQPEPAIPAEPAPDAPAEWVDPGRLLAEVATQLWRMRRLMVEPGTDLPQDVMRRPFRHLDALQDTLGASGLRAVDHTGQRYDPGMSLTIIACEERPDLEQERVIETLRPTVVFDGRRIQIGEVILAIPPTRSEPEPTSDESSDHD